MDDLPVPLGDAIRVKGCACNDLPGDRESRHADAVWFQVGPELVAADRRAALPRETVAKAGIG
jgi:hypothetical protein